MLLQRPLLEFQRAKLAFEEKLQAAGDITYSIVRPTAFFKSLAGQVTQQAARVGWPCSVARYMLAYHCLVWMLSRRQRGTLNFVR